MLKIPLGASVPAAPMLSHEKIGKRAGVDNVHPHRFRRTAATMALRHGMPIEMVSRMLRHDKLQTTMIYLDLDERELQYQHAKYVG